MAMALGSFTLVAISGRAAGKGVDTAHLMFYRSAIALDKHADGASPTFLFGAVHRSDLVLHLRVDMVQSRPGRSCLARRPDRKR